MRTTGLNEGLQAESKEMSTVVRMSLSPENELSTANHFETQPNGLTDQELRN